MKRPVVALAVAALAVPWALTACSKSDPAVGSSTTPAVVSAATIDCVVDAVSDWTLAEMQEADSGAMGPEVEAKWNDAKASCGAAVASDAASASAS